MTMKMVLPTWLDHPEDSFSYKEVQFNKFSHPVITSCPPSENKILLMKALKKHGERIFQYS